MIELAIRGVAWDYDSVGEDFVDNDGSPCEWADEAGGDQVFRPIPKPKDIMDELKSMYYRESKEGVDDAPREDK